MKKMTESQQIHLIGCLLYGHLPIGMIATIEALKAKGLLMRMDKGNIILTKAGRVIATELLQKRLTKIGKR